MIRLYKSPTSFSKSNPPIEMLRTQFSTRSQERVLVSENPRLSHSRRRNVGYAFSRVMGTWSNEVIQNVSSRVAVSESSTQFWDLNVANLSRDYYEDSSTTELLSLFSDLTKQRRIDCALLVLRELIEAGRSDVLCSVIHKDFIRKADPKSAIKFLEIMPIEFIDCRTFNMVASRCVQARDLKKTIQTVDLMKRRGLELDLPIYTNLISAYGAVGNVHEAFRIYSEMNASGLVPDVKVLGALAKVCATKLKTSREGERRQDLVLLERAADLLQDLHDHKIVADTQLWNILVSCAGRAGQSKRALDLVQQMKEAHCVADSTTFCAMIDACVKTKERQLGLKIYHLALKEVSQLETALFTVTIELCMCGDEPVDVDTVLEIYREADRQDLKLDTHFFTTLIRAVGKGGALDLALSIEDNMRLQGVDRCTNSCSALLAASLASSDLQLADQIYKKMSSKGILPGLFQFTNLMRAYVKFHRFGDMVALLDDMISADLELDDVVFTTILKACLQDGLHDLGFTVFTLLRARGIRISPIVVHEMLSICLNELITYRNGTRMSPERPSVESTEGIALLRVLCKDRELPAVQEASPALWTDRAVSLYRTVYSDQTSPAPTLEILSKLYNCLRVPYRQQKGKGSKDYAVPEELSFDPYREEFKAPQMQSTVAMMEECFDRRILQLVKEGIAQGLLMNFTTEYPERVDLRGLPPAVAEAYVFTIMETLRFRYRNKTHYRFKWVFNVAPFDPKEAMVPSIVRKTEKSGEDDILTQDEATALGVIALLRRLRIWHKTLPRRGVIIIHPQILTKWIKKDDNPSSFDDGEGGGNVWRSMRREISAQQREIRIMNGTSRDKQKESVED